MIELNDFDMPTICVDKNRTEMDWETWTYIMSQLQAARNRGERAVNLLIQRLPTDPVRDKLEFIEHQKHERDNTPAIGCWWCGTICSHNYQELTELDGPVFTERCSKCGWEKPINE